MLRALLLAFAALLLVAARPPAASGYDDLLKQLHAESKRVNEMTFGFERVTEAIQDGKRTLRVDRYDPNAASKWTLVSIDGRPPTRDEVHKYEKGLVDWKVPNYGRVAELIEHTKPSRVAPDRYRLDDLPPEILDKRARIFASHVSTELKVGGTPAQPYVTESQVFAPKPFRVMVVAKIDKFIAISRYAPGPDGRPRIRSQEVDLKLTIMGAPRRVQSKMTYRDL